MSLNSRPLELIEANKLTERLGRALDTGGAGFIGSRIVEGLLKGDRKVVVLDNFSTGRKDNLGPVSKGSEIRMERGDVQEPAAVRRAPQGKDRAFHLAVTVRWYAGSRKKVVE